jgi:hypothetical protein
LKKIILVAIMFLLFAGVVSASSINGDYKGNPIVKVMSNGKQLQSDEVPAMIYDGHTVVPISLLRQIGVSVNWNADAYSVDVKLPQQQTATNLNFRDILKSTNGNISFQMFGDKLAVTSNFEMKTSFSQDWPEIFKVINKLTEQDVDNYNINYMSNGKSLGMVGLDRKSAEDFASGKIDSKELTKRWVLTGFQNQQAPQSNQPAQTPGTLPQQTQQTQSQNNNAQMVDQYNSLEGFYFTLQKSVLIISGFVVTTDQYYDKWNTGSADKMPDSQLGQEYKKATDQANEIYSTAVALEPKTVNIDRTKLNELIQELYSLSTGIISTHDNIYSWKVAKFDNPNDKFNVNIKIADGYLNDYTNNSRNLFNRAMQLNEKLKTEINNIKGIVNTLQ